jgi:PAS domain S-box-containing protein
MNEQLSEVSEQDELVTLRNAVHAANNVVLLTDPNLPDNPIIYANGGFEALTGYRWDEVMGRNCRFLQGRDHRQKGIDDPRAVIRERRSVRVELRNYRKDGTLFWNKSTSRRSLTGSASAIFWGCKTTSPGAKRPRGSAR